MVSLPAAALSLHTAVAVACAAVSRGYARRRRRVTTRERVAVATLGGAAGFLAALALGVDASVAARARAAGAGYEVATTAGTVALLLGPVPATALAALLALPGGAPARRVRRFAAGYAAVVGPAVLGLAVVPAVPSGWGLVAGATVVGLLAAGGTPLALRLVFPTRRPTAAERAWLADATDLPVRVVDTGGRHANALAAGLLPGLRYVYVTERLLRSLPPAEAAAIVAHEAGHHRRRHAALRLGAVGAFVLPWLGATAADVPGAFVAGALAAAPVALGVLALARWTEYDADRYAAGRVGASPLAAALRRLTDERLLDDGGGWLSLHPPVRERVARLERSGRSAPDEARPRPGDD